MLIFCQNIVSPLFNSAGRASGIITSQRYVKKSVLVKLGLPAPPKRPLNPYSLFCKEQLPNLKKKHPESKQSELIVMVSQLWQHVDESQKSALKARSDSEKAAYEKAKAAFEDVIKPHESDILKAEKKQLLRETRKETTKILEKLGKPKRPASAFALFVSSQKSVRGDLSAPEFVKVVAEKWQELPEDKKKEYQGVYLNDVKEYEKQLKSWENKMISQGLQEFISKDINKKPKKKEVEKEV